MKPLFFRRFALALLVLMLTFAARPATAADTVAAEQEKLAKVEALASQLELTPDQKKQIVEIRKKYAAPSQRRQAIFNVLNRTQKVKLLQMLKAEKAQKAASTAT